jgi:nucleoside-diphosphate-sugar epimerase
MKILITGATGFIGTARTDHLLKQGHEIIAVGRTHVTTNASIRHYTGIEEKDSIKHLAARYMPDRIEHFASQATVSVSREDPYSTYKDNVLGTVSVLETAKQLNIPVLLFTTDKYYGDLSTADENDRPVVTSGAYETSKFCQDIIGQSYRKAGVSVTIVRSCNVFGPNDPNRRIVPNSIRDLQTGRRPVIFTNIRGVRQFVYISDLLQALDCITDKGQNETFNVGTEIHLSQKEVVELICHIWNEKHHTYVAPRYEKGKDIKEIPEQYLKWEKLANLGWYPNYTMAQGLDEMM